MSTSMQARNGSPCVRWAELSDRISIGEPVESSDLTFLRSHASVCDACSEEARLYTQLGSLLEDGASEHGQQQGHEQEQSPSAQPRPSEVVLRPAASRVRTSRRAWIGIAAATALAAGALLYVWTGSTPASQAPFASPSPSPLPSGAPVAPLPSSSPASAPATVALLEGEATVDAATSSAGAAVKSGSVLATGHGRACLALEPGMRVCLAPSSQLRIEKVEGPARVLRLVHGRVAAELDPQPAGSSFSIAAADGSVTAIGTAFSVELEEGSPVVARVSHGVVLVRDGNSESSHERKLHAHEATRFGEGVRELPSSEEDADRALLRPRPESASPPALGAPPAMLTAPLAVPVPPVTPASLLADARAARARGDTTAAARAYRTLLTAHPASPEASAATLSLAELELSRGASAEALTLYDRYIARGGPLLLEARYGKVRALGQLGRASEAQTESAAFVRDYPDSPQADALRPRTP